MLELNVHRVTLTAERPLTQDNVIGLRGFYGAHYRENPGMKAFLDKSHTFRYPAMQYKVIEGEGMVVGFGEGATVLQSLPFPETLRLGSEDLPLVSARSGNEQAQWGLAERKIKYRVLTPWIGMDEQDTAKYFRLKNPDVQKYFLSGLLIGSIVTASKLLNYRIPGMINAEFLELKPITVEPYGKPQLGFKGTMAVNFVLPDYFGVGKSIAQGYGAVKRIDEGCNNP
ncbi:MAG: CRISPR-associated endonuclease Cas6 [Candidatus Edwardsbacteria bacterium]|nr:CRISPR-associated endonuclease Cas6 [Candidatus Edwardsbacteria bacterium]